MRYEIKEAPFGILICQLEQGESMKCQHGGMAWMDRGIEMATKTGGLGKMFKKAFTGENIFYNTYTAYQPGEIAFAMSFPGRIMSIDVSRAPIIAQKGSFLACEPTVDVDIFFRKKLSAGIFGGEGFILQQFSGRGMTFLEVDGGLIEKELAPGQEVIIDSGHLAAMEASCTLNVETVKGLGNIVAGGEGLFNTVITGPGKVWLQTMPIVNLAGALQPYIVTTSS
ncbi:MAG: TIGR00266 family protein [Eubacteriales bacterium]|jgi:uncharacterized protein (TIGR00266 family)|nr:TIGR00266 family protein [Eubacteriales bacterium]